MLICMDLKRIQVNTGRVLWRVIKEEGCQAHVPQLGGNEWKNAQLAPGQAPSWLPIPLALYSSSSSICVPNPSNNWLLFIHQNILKASTLTVTISFPLLSFFFFGSGVVESERPVLESQLDHLLVEWHWIIHFPCRVLVYSSVKMDIYISLFGKFIMNEYNGHTINTLKI